MDGVLTLHEVMHHIHVKKRDWCDFEKVYDKVNWDFLLSFFLKPHTLFINDLTQLLHQ